MCVISTSITFYFNIYLKFNSVPAPIVLLCHYHHHHHHHLSHHHHHYNHEVLLMRHINVPWPFNINQCFCVNGTFLMIESINAYMSIPRYVVCARFSIRGCRLYQCLSMLFQYRNRQRWHFAELSWQRMCSLVTV